MFNTLITLAEVANIQNSKYDTRTFGEIYQSLPVSDAREFRRQMALAYTSQMSISRWARGIVIPHSDKMAAIVKSLRKVGVNTTPATLFPNSIH